MKLGPRLQQRSNAKPRLLKIKFEKERARGHMLRNSKTFRTLSREEYPVESNIYITPDLTPKQREENRKLRLALFRKKKETRNEKWMIKNGKIVERTHPANRPATSH